MTLNEVMKDTADAIREKTGKSEKIAPINFAEEIKSISAGGGESGGSDEWVYYDLRNQENKTIFSIIAQLIPHSLAAILEYGEPKLQHGVQFMSYEQNNPSNVGLDNMLGFGYLASHKIKVGDKVITGREYIELVGGADILESTPKITEAEFYDLNA